MVKLQGDNIHLGTLERADCKKIWEDTEYNFSQLTEPFIVGRSSANADGWFDDIQKQQGNTHIRLGICHLGLERISASTQENNIGSQRVLEKCGFTLEGRERKARYFAGKRHDRLICGLLAEEFLEGAKQ